MITRNPAGAAPTQTLTWDPLQRLSTVTEGSTVTEFRYDADGGRIRRKAGSDVSYYFAGGEYHHDGTTSTFTYYHHMGGQNVAMTVDGELTFIYADQVGSTSFTRTESGVNKTQRYTPYGEIRTNGNLTIDRQYTGQINDETTGLYHYNARYYDPALGRFVSPDTIVPDAADGQDYNRYMYVRGNPVRYNDPTGHCTSWSEEEGCFIQGNGWTYSQSRGQQIMTTEQAEWYVDDATKYAFADVPSHEAGGPGLTPEQAISIFVGGSGLEAENAIEVFMDCETAARSLGTSCQEVDLLSGFELPNSPSVRQWWTIGTTVVAVVCFTASGGTCGLLIYSIAAVNTGISLVDNRVLEVDAEGVRAGEGGCLPNVARDAVANWLPIGAGNLVRNSNTVLGTAMDEGEKGIVYGTNFVGLSINTGNAVDPHYGCP